MKWDFLSIGGSVFDVFVQAEHEKVLRMSDQKAFQDFLLFPLGEKLDIGKLHSAFGGGAANVSVGLSQAGFKAAIFSVVGDDYYGHEIIRNLKSRGVAVEGVKRIKNIASGLSLVLNSFDGERTILSSRTANRSINAKGLPKFLNASSWVHLTSLAGNHSDIFREVVAWKKRYPKRHLSWNPGIDQLETGMGPMKSFLRSLDVIFLNKEELERITRMKCISCKHQKSGIIFDIYKPAMKLLASGVRMVIVTDGKRGAQLLTKKEHLYVPCAPVKAVSTLGAGDAFCSGFLTGWVRKGDARTALRYATANAASVIQIFGGQMGLLKKSQFESKSKGIPVVSML